MFQKSFGWLHVNAASFDFVASKLTYIHVVHCTTSVIIVDYFSCTLFACLIPSLFRLEPIYSSQIPKC